MLNYRFEYQFLVVAKTMVWENKHFSLLKKIVVINRAFASTAQIMKHFSTGRRKCGIRLIWMHAYRNLNIFSQIDNLLDRFVEVINVFQPCMKLLKSNLQELYLIKGNIFDHFWLALYINNKMYSHHKVF